MCIMLRAVPWSAVILVLVVSTTSPIVLARELLPVAEIVSVDVPSRVSPGETFSVSVTVDYSGSYSTDVAILDRATRFVLASKGLIIPAGRNLFSFSLVGREIPGVWTLLASVRTWWHDGWYADQVGGIFPFETTVSEPALATFSIRSNLSSNIVKVDGISHSLLSNELVLPIARGVHTIETQLLVDIGEGTRAIFDHWSDGVGSPIRTVYVEDQLDLSAVYLTEFFLTVESSVSETVGSGWYPAGMNATFFALNPSTSVNAELVYKFTRWSGDSDSTSRVGWTILDRPKGVSANWSQETTQPTTARQLPTAPLVFAFCSALLVCAAFILAGRTRIRSHSHASGKSILKGLALVAIFLAASAHSGETSLVYALPVLEPRSVTIGNASWYHWNQAASDTLLVWLGGGVVDQSVFLLNPYEFESYNTMRFVQDLARYYDILALERGTARSMDPMLNRTMLREAYISSSARNFMEKIHHWAHEQDYAYLFVVSYSVGAMIAASELVLTNPEEWTSPNGLIIITTKIPQAASSKASTLRSSLLMLYGDKIAPEFTVSGENFFQRAPHEGWEDTYWYHKEFHVIPDVEHEVWTVKDSGEYDDRALLLTITFIETTKGLQFEQVKQNIESIVPDFNTRTWEKSPYKVTVASATWPSRIGTREAFRIDSVVQFDLPSNLTVAVVAYDPDTGLIASAAEKKLAGNGRAPFAITIPSGEASRIVHLLLVPLVYTEGRWNLSEEGVSDVLVEVHEGYALTVITGYPNVPVEFDRQRFHTTTDGHLTLNTTAGRHLISVPPILTINNASRLVFQQWNGTLDLSDLQVEVSRDVTLFAIYRQQYRLEVSSPLGQTAGTGWYDNNSAVSFYLASPVVVVDNATHVFAGWRGDSYDSSPSSIVYMNASKEIHASWEEFENTDSSLNSKQVPRPIAPALLMPLASVIILVASVCSSKRLEALNEGWVSLAPSTMDPRKD